MDIKEFNPSITQQLLNDAIDFAKAYSTIGLFFLFFKDEAWKKKSTENSFDITMGSYDGAEICELVGLLILHKLSALINKRDIGQRIDGSQKLERPSDR